MKRSYLLAGTVIMLVVCLLTYSNHFHNDFHFDDSHTIQSNPAIRNIHNIPLFFKDGTTISVLPQNQAYRPLTVTSLAVDYWLGHGYNLFYFHLSTFILFLIQGVLMILLFLKIFGISATKKTSAYAALIATTWYMLHPAIAETVNYIIARADLQSTLFVVLALVLYAYSPFCRKTYLYLIAVIIGGLAKPPVVMFAPLLLFYVLFFEEDMSIADVFKKQNWQRTLSVIKKTIPSFICCAVLYLFIDKMTPKTWVPGGTSPLLYLVTQPFVILHYFTTLFFPNGLSADSDWALLTSMWDIRFFIGILFIIVMVVIAYHTSKKQTLRPISYGILWFFLTLLPTSSIIPLAEVLNDHRIFFPYIGLVMATGWTIALLFVWISTKVTISISKYNAYGVIGLLIILPLYAYGTYERNEVWHTEESLWYDVTVKSPLNGRGLMNYALTKMAKGEYDVADSYFTRALILLPNYNLLYTNIAVLKWTRGDVAGAEPNYLKAIQLNDNVPDTHYFYAIFLDKQKRYNEAATQLNRTIELSPAYLNARLLLMEVYQSTNDWDRLKQLAQATLTIVPGDAQVLSYLNAGIQHKDKFDELNELAKTTASPEKYLQLSLDYYQAGMYDKCIVAATEATKLRPYYPEAFNNIGSAYNVLKQYDKAIVALKQALALKPDFQLAKNNLIAAQNGLKAPASVTVAQAQAPLQPTAESLLTESLNDYNQGQFQKCIDACYKALTLRPGYDLAYNNICAAYNKLSQWDNAIKAAKKGLEYNPGNQLLKNNMAVALKSKSGGH